MAPLSQALQLIAAAGLSISVPLAAVHTLWSSLPPAQSSTQPASVEIQQTHLSNLQVEQPVEGAGAVHPDEPLTVTLQERFSYSNALERLAQIEEALNSFRTLTTAYSSGSNQPAIATISDTDWESQNLGFHNWVGSVEGTVRYQDLQIKQLEAELAQKQFEDGEITQADLNQETTEYQQAIADFQTFLKSFSIAD